MGTNRIKIQDSLKEKLMLIPKLDCGNFATRMIQVGKTLTMHYIRNKKEIDCEELSKEFTINANSHLRKFVKLNGYLPEETSFCFAPTIEGGNEYNLYFKTFKKAKHFGFDVFKYSIGIKLHDYGYCCYYVRTTILHSTKQVKRNYAFMMSVYQNVLENLVDGMELCKVYETVHSFAKQRNNKLATHLEKEFGFELTHNFKNRSVLINSDSKVVARNNMIFAININLIGLREKGMEYSLSYCDTILVRKDQKPMKLLTYDATQSEVKRIISAKSGKNVGIKRKFVQI